MSPSSPAATSPRHADDRRPATRRLVAILVLAGSAIGWVWLLAAIAAMLATTDMATLGPGMGLFNQLNGFDHLPASVRAGLSILCGPGGLQAWGAGDFAAVFGMWVAMVLAMMLPSATPMLVNVAARAGGASGRFGSILILASGYLTVWVGFAAAATLLQWALQQARTHVAALGPMTTILAATTFLAAAAYQVTPLKLACLTRCRFPAPAFLPERTGPGDLFRIGLAEGIACLGCCWALMVVMFAAGVMNILWIAILGAAMTYEKLGRGPWPSRLIALLLALAGAALLATSPIVARML